jgi:chromosome segregation ATPase
VVAVNPAAADKLKQMVASVAVSDDTDETVNVHQKMNEGNTKVVGAEQTMKKADKSTLEETHMDKDVKEISIDSATLAASLEALTKECDSLKTTINAKTTEVTELKSMVESKDSEIQRLTEDQASLQSKMSKNLATALASLRARLQKPDTIGIDSKEKLGEYVDKLAERSCESLEDSINDLVLELDEDSAPVKKTTTERTASDIVKDSRIESPVPDKAMKPSIGSKKNVDALDNALELD